MKILLRLGPGVDDKKRRLVVYDKKRMWNIIILSRGDVEVVTDPFDNPPQNEFETRVLTARHTLPRGRRE